MPQEDPEAGVPVEEVLRPYKDEGKEVRMRPFIPLRQKVIGGIGGVVLIILVLLLIAFLIALTTGKGSPI